MKKALLLLGTFLLTGFFVSAQNITAATGVNKGRIDFNDFRTIDIENLDASNVILSKTDKITLESANTEIEKICSCGKYIAAITESLSGDLFYIPMTNAKVMQVNATSKSAEQNVIPNSLMNVKDQGTFYARMTTAPDGYMYAMNNSGTEFIKISPNGTVQNLGAVDGFAKKAKTFEQTTAVYGGDMVADAFGNIYVISAAANTFKINPKTLSSEYLGKIKGLPSNYTVNGAAVMEDGSVLLGTTSQNGFYTLDFDSLEATFARDYALAVYDLSSPYFLRQAEKDQMTSLAMEYSMYPTVVKNSQMNIVSNSDKNAVLNVSVWDLNKKQVYSNKISIQAISEYQVNLSGSLQPGVYVLKAVNQNGVEVINTKFSLLR